MKLKVITKFYGREFARSWFADDRETVQEQKEKLCSIVMRVTGQRLDPADFYFEACLGFTFSREDPRLRTTEYKPAELYVGQLPCVPANKYGRVSSPADAEFDLAVLYVRRAVPGGCWLPMWGWGLTPHTWLPPRLFLPRRRW